MSKPEYSIAFTARESAELEPSQRDAAPVAPHEVTGRTLVSLVSAGTELLGAYQGDAFPVHPGYAAVFQVEEAGAEVTHLRPGDLAYCSGPHRSWQRVSGERALRVPEGLPADHAVFCRLMGVSMTTLATTPARPPSPVLVTGLGLVGHLAAKIFDSCGYEVHACDPSPLRRKIAAQAGIPNVIPSVREEDPELLDRVGLVVECSGHESAVLDACRVVRKGGEVVLVGAPWRRYTETSAQELTRLIFFRYLTVRSGWEWELPQHPSDFRPLSIWTNYAAALSWLGERRVVVEDLCERISPRDAQSTYQALLHGKVERLAVLFDWSGI